MNWDDMRIALAVARNGTHAAAAKLLNIDAATVGRRIAQLERDMHGGLFQKRHGGWTITPLGEALVAQAERMEAAAEIAARSGVAESRLEGTVRITATDSVSALILAPRLGMLRTVAPRVRIELVPASGRLNLTRREADMAIRLARPRDSGTVVRRIGELDFALYGTSHALPLPEDTPWVEYDDTLTDLPEARWSRAIRGGGDVALRSNHVETLREAIAVGYGVGVLPCFLGDADARLQRLPAPADAPKRPVWLVIPESLRGTPRIRVIAEWVASAFRDPGRG